MKKFKPVAIILTIATCLISVFAFTRKQVLIVDYLYTPRSGQTYIPPGIPGASIVISELNTNILCNWAVGSNSHHQQADYLMGIEFDAAEQSLQMATNIIHRFYTTGSTAGILPNNGQNISGVIVFRFSIKNL